MTHINCIISHPAKLLQDRPFSYPLELFRNWIYRRRKVTHRLWRHMSVPRRNSSLGACSVLRQRPNVNQIRPCSVKIWSRPRINVWRLMYKNSLWIQRLHHDLHCMQFCCYYRFWKFGSPYNCVKFNRSWISILSNVLKLRFRSMTIRGLTGQKMSRCCPTLSGLWGPLVGPLLGRTCWFWVSTAVSGKMRGKYTLLIPGFWCVDIIPDVAVYEACYLLLAVSYCCYDAVR